MDFEVVGQEAVGAHVVITVWALEQRVVRLQPRKKPQYK
jgi:hypothetical protein